MLMRLLLRLLQRRMDISNNLCYRAPRALFTLLPFLPIAAFNKAYGRYVPSHICPRRYVLNLLLSFYVIF